MSLTKKKNLSERQSRLLYEICEYYRAHNDSPSLIELGKRMNISSNTVCITLKRLKALGYIKAKPYSHSWEILKWYDDSNSRDVDISGVLYDDHPIIYRNGPIGQARLPLSESKLQVAPNLFALRLVHRRDSDPQFKVSIGDLLVFQKHKEINPGNYVIAFLNRQCGLYKFSPSQTQITLKQGTDEQDAILLRSEDELNVVGAMFMPFNRSTMLLI